MNKDQTIQFVQDAAERVREENKQTIEGLRQVHGDAVAAAAEAIGDMLALATGVLKMNESAPESLPQILARLAAHDLMSKLLSLTAHHIRAAHALNEVQWEIAKDIGKKIVDHTASGAAAIMETVSAVREAQESETLQQ